MGGGGGLVLFMQKAAANNRGGPLQVELDRQSFEEIFNELGINPDLCPEAINSAWSIVKNSEIDARTKSDILVLLLNYVLDAPNNDEKKALYLFMFGALYFLFLKDYHSYITFIHHLIALIKSGRVKIGFVKFLLRRLKNYGINTEDLEEAIRYAQAHYNNG